MPTNPIEEWQRLSALYREMGDVEIGELADGIDDLTEVAQQALRDELKKRGLFEAPAVQDLPGVVNQAAAVHYEPSSYRYEFPDSGGKGETDSPREYTWKTELCECETTEEALPIALVLKQAGIDSWIDRPRARWSLSGPRILVAADQLDRAREIIARPIPDDIVRQSREMEEASAFESPVCPKCGAADPTLESADPSNSWHCESCGNDWTDPIDGKVPA
jgi:hypothetical protein